MTTWEFRATHVVPQSGMPAWETPDVSRPTAPLDPLLPVQLAERRGDWGRIVCANSWSAWVDGRLLVPVPQDPPTVGGPVARTADPRPLLARVGETLAGYRRAVEDLADGLSDGETFRGRTRGLRVGLVVDGESMWLYDAEHERWAYCDGLRLNTFATSSRPASAAGDAGVSGSRPAQWPGADPPGADPPDPVRTVPPDSVRPVPEPTQVVAAPERTASPDLGTRSSDGPGGEGTPWHEPTRIVDPHNTGGAGQREPEEPSPRATEDEEEATRLLEPPPRPDEERPDATRAVERPEAARDRGGDR